MTRSGKWIILRTASRATLSLAKSLREDGFDVWTPTSNYLMQLPRMNVRAPVQEAILPSFIFGPWEQRAELCRLAAQPPRRFSVMHVGDDLAQVLDSDKGMLHLRRLEQKRTYRPKPTWKWKRGAEVRVNREGDSFDGMTGIVRHSDNAVTIVCFDAWFDKVKIETSLLSGDDAYRLQSDTDASRLEAA